MEAAETGIPPMSRKSRAGKRLVKRKSSYAPGPGEGDRERGTVHRLREEERRGC
jgi:hypothetical protein